ncbi:KH domain-containing protein [Candidatus Microgenomates bacterium]|nr:KH domain-containing protein [Candidatus Microgenomates bacterium]
MKNLLDFLLKNITGSDDFSIEETEENDRVTFQVIADKEIIGLIIGKEGKTIKTLRKVLSIPATLNQKSVNISVTEK